MHDNLTNITDDVTYSTIWLCCIFCFFYLIILSSDFIFLCSTIILLITVQKYIEIKDQENSMSLVIYSKIVSVRFGLP